MKFLRFIYKIITNPIIGPIVVASTALILLAIFYLPSLSLNNQKEKITRESKEIVHHLKTFRSYYNEFVVSKVKNLPDIKVDYNHEYSSNTIPLPATTIHNISEKLSQNKNVKVNFFSDYPFPNRANRVLDEFQKNSIKFLRENPNEIFIKQDIVNNKEVIRVAFSDTMGSNSCLACHNGRADSPKKDWKLGDVRGVLEVVMPIHEEFVLSSIHTRNILIFILLVILYFIIHYTILYLLKQKETKEQTKKLQDEVEKQTKDLKDSNRLLLEHKKAVDASAIVSKADLDGNITYVSEAFCKISGYSKEELIGQNHKIIKHYDMLDSTYKELWETISSGKVWEGEIKNKKKNGDYYWVKASISPIYDNKQTIIGYTAIRQDITDKKRIEEISITDGLTNIYNRRYFDEVFPKIINSAKRKNELIAFLFMDIDHFKQYNDNYGHQKGDDVLIKFAKCLKDSLHRSSDLAFRLGGEEFALVYQPETKEKAIEFANTIKNNIEKLQIKHEFSSVRLYITASMGLVCKNANDIDKNIYKEADDLLYEAKKSGRNQVKVNE